MTMVTMVTIPKATRCARAHARARTREDGVRYRHHRHYHHLGCEHRRIMPARQWTSLSLDSQPRGRQAYPPEDATNAEVKSSGFGTGVTREEDFRDGTPPRACLPQHANDARSSGAHGIGLGVDDSPLPAPVRQRPYPPLAVGRRWQRGAASPPR